MTSSPWFAVAVFALLLVPSIAVAQGCEVQTSCNRTITGVTGCPGATTDTVYFDIPAQTRVTIAVKGFDGFDPAVIFTDATFNEPLASDNDSGPGNEALITYTTRFSHTYLAVVHGNDGHGGFTGPYQLTLTCEPASVTVCIPDENTMCLADGRFRVQVTWRGHHGDNGGGKVVPIQSANSGLFWFFHPDNWELLVKAIDGCAFNNHWWIYSAATTDVEYLMTVTDTKTGAVKQYLNERTVRARAVTDSTAFATCP